MNQSGCYQSHIENWIYNPKFYNVSGRDNGNFNKALDNGFTVARWFSSILGLITASLIFKFKHLQTHPNKLIAWSLVFGAALNFMNTNGYIIHDYFCDDDYDDHDDHGFSFA